MFGIKKKKKANTKVAKVEAAGQIPEFEVHTMQDDLDAINGVMLGAQERGRARETAPGQSPQTSTPITENPFLAQGAQMKNSAPSTIPKESAAFAQTEKARPQGYESTQQDSISQMPIAEKMGSAGDPTASAISSQKVTLETDSPFAQKNIQSESSVPTQGKPQQIVMEDTPPPQKKTTTSIESEIANIAGIATGPPSLSQSLPQQQHTSKQQIDYTADFFDVEGTNTAGEDVISLPTTSAKGSDTGRGIIKMLGVIILLLIVSATALAAWYWYNGNDLTKYIPGRSVLSSAEILAQEGEVQGVDLEQEKQIEMEIKPPTKELKKYDTNFPNYIEVSATDTARKEIQEKLVEIEKEMMSQDLTSPISFLVTDSSGSPLTFQAFSTIMEMKLEPEALEAAGEVFEIYAVKDQSKIRFGLGVDLKDQQAMRIAMRAHESQLSQSTSFLIMDPQVTLDSEEFDDNVYGKYAIRYVNLTDDERYAIDYAIDERLFLGTSKKSHRDILEKYGNKQIIPSAEDLTLEAGVQESDELNSNTAN